MDAESRPGGNFRVVTGAEGSIANVSETTYRRGWTVALFILDVFAGLYLLAATVVMGAVRGFGGAPQAAFHDYWQYWVNISILALITFGIIWNVRAASREGERFAPGVVFAVLSAFPVLFGVWMLVLP